VLFAQNGIPWWYASGLSASRPRPPDLSRLDPGGHLSRAIARENIIGAIIYSANGLIEPGVVRNHTPGNNMLVVGECDDRSSERIIKLRNILEQSGMSSPAVDDIRQVVWNKLNLNLSTGTLCLLAGCTVGEMRTDPRLSEIAKRVAAESRAIGHKPSILQDYETGRPMEIEAQLASPLAFARAAGVATPTLDALVPLAVHKAAARGLYTT
jgi:2-dehydropantoate 2-reductase